MTVTGPNPRTFTTFCVFSVCLSLLLVWIEACEPVDIEKDQKAQVGLKKLLERRVGQHPSNAPHGNFHMEVDHLYVCLAMLRGYRYNYNWTGEHYITHGRSISDPFVNCYGVYRVEYLSSQVVEELDGPYCHPTA